MAMTVVMLITFSCVCFVFYVMGFEEGVQRTEEKMDAERRMFFGMQITKAKEDEHENH